MDETDDMSLPPPSLRPPGTEDPLPVLSSSDKPPSLLSLRVEKPADVPDPKREVVVLPQALEQLFALKDQRAQELGVVSEEQVDLKPVEKPAPNAVIPEYGGDGEDSDEGETEGSQVPPPKTKLNKNKRKKERKKARRAQKNQIVEKEEEKVNEKDEETGETQEPQAEIEYIQETLGITDLAPMYRQFYKIFEAFKITDPTKDPKMEMTYTEVEKPYVSKQVETDEFKQRDGEDDDRKGDGDKPKLSKRKLKKLTRLSVAELKQLVSRPDVVEMHDVTARDPRLLVQLKAYRNTVQVPRHWCFKRKYLQGKRGIEKPPFNLPDFIKRTGIMEMRASLQDKEEAKTLKTKMRERVRPKLGKIDIDYQKLHDAFFKWQTKPKMTIHGDLYYEGKEYETRLREKKPGDLSEDLRTALGMPLGPNAYKVPPPWLIAMQRYGPPPSYPSLKIPGLNAPIPEGCSFGYHAGGWGKPPVDETGRPLYGDVFAVQVSHADDDLEEPEVDRRRWGEMESEDEEPSDEEEEEDEGSENGEETQDSEAIAAGLATPAEGLATPSGMTSVPAGLETPDTIELRKKKIDSEMQGTDTPQLYTVLPERRNERLGNAMMASTHVYDVPGTKKTVPLSAPPPPVISDRTVELALDPSELELDADAMAVRYEQQVREQQSQLQKEDLSDMLADHVARQKTKRKRQTTTTETKNKKYKEFKF